jgi:hypothetical protein
MPLSKSAKSLQACIFRIFILAVVISITNTLAAAENYPALNDEDRHWIGQKIFNNECAMQIDCLTSWNPGEDFPSLGIGHFIWYQQNQDEIFDESFPDLLRYLEEQGFNIPNWIAASDYSSPWQNREEFLDNFSGVELSELRSLLADTFPEQTAFIIRRFEAALDRMLAVVPEFAPENGIDAIEEKFYRVANAYPPYGMYALIDYVNFKGEGVSINERYSGAGWGLLQVLSLMPDSDEDILENFVNSAKRVLQNRVSNAPPERNEEQWLQGWFNRLDTYLPETTDLTESSSSTLQEII